MAYLNNEYFNPAYWNPAYWDLDEASAVFGWTTTTPLSHSIMNIYETASFPWDYYRNPTSFPTRETSGLGWQFETNQTADNLLPARIRKKLGGLNVMGRYCTPSKTYKPTRPVNGNDVYCPWTTAVNTYFSAVLDDETLSPYLHTAEPFAEANRKAYIIETPQESFWLRFAQDNVLDYVFGESGGSGKRADGSDCWVAQRHLNVDINTRILCVDSIVLDAYCVNIIEEGYNSIADWYSSLSVFLDAYQDRICTPRNMKMIGNMGFYLADYAYAPFILAHLDGIVTEYWFSRTINSTLSKLYAWDTGDYRLYEQIEIMKYLVANDKIIGLGQLAFLLPMYLTCASGSGNVKVYHTAAGRAIAVSHSSIDAGAYTDYLLDSYSSIASLITAMEVKYGSVITFQQGVVTYGCDYLAKYDHPQLLADMTARAFTTAGAYVTAREPGRYNYLTLLSMFVLAGGSVLNADKVYLGMNPNSVSNWLNQLERVTDLVNLPLGYPDVAVSDYTIYPGQVDDIYYRKLMTTLGGSTVQAIAVLNWTSTAKTVSAVDFGLTYFVNPHKSYFIGSSGSASTVTSISLPPYCGTVLLNGGL